MRPMKRVLSGALALCVAGFLTGCGSSGRTRADPPPQPVKTVLQETPVLQLVPIDRTLTEIPQLAPVPTPETAYSPPACTRPAGCFSNRQLETMLSEALAWGGASADNLRAIRRASDEATKPPPAATGRPP